MIYPVGRGHMTIGKHAVYDNLSGPGQMMEDAAKGQEFYKQYVEHKEELDKLETAVQADPDNDHLEYLRRNIWSIVNHYKNKLDQVGWPEQRPNAPKLPSFFKHETREINA